MPSVHNGIIDAAEAGNLARESGGDVAALMTSLLPRAAEFARPPISNFKVGAIARGVSGALYFGANVEFAGEALSFTVHAEQSAVSNAWMSGERGIDLIAVTAAPCGYCRQFLNELATADQLIIAMPNVTSALTELLPSAFGPRDLGIDGGLLQADDHFLTIESDDELARAALAAANMSYAPYSKAFAGVAVRTSDGTIASGAYAENAAFNPSMSPLEVALSQLNLRGLTFDSITDAVLVQTGTLHTNATRTVLAAVCDAPLRLIGARNSS
ncbi:MAG: cytidine deaminase [Acidobacteriota bacterium]|nr:cytidine deaminase [Acidobacteriota bacterium]